MEDIVNYTKRCKRYVIRRTDNQTYYGGKYTYCGGDFGDFESAKVYKNISGAKLACNEMTSCMRKPENTFGLEIVEIVIIATDKVIPYIKNK